MDMTGREVRIDDRLRFIEQGKKCGRKGVHRGDEGCKRRLYDLRELGPIVTEDGYVVGDADAAMRKTIQGASRATVGNSKESSRAPGGGALLPEVGGGATGNLGGIISKIATAMNNLGVGKFEFASEFLKMSDAFNDLWVLFGLAD